MDERWASLSIHAEYLPKLARLRKRHRRSYANIVEILIDKALDNDALLIPTLSPSAVLLVTPGEATGAPAAQSENRPTPYGPGATSH